MDLLNIIGNNTITVLCTLMFSNTFLLFDTLYLLFYFFYFIDLYIYIFFSLHVFLNKL